MIVEDDPVIGPALAQALREVGYAADLLTDTDAASTHLDLETCDLAILDVRLPGSLGDGFALCAQIRRRSAGTPILMLTALDARAAKIRGLDLGADDYVTKPFHLDELLARVRALMRRAPVATAPTLVAGGLALDPRTLVATTSDAAVQLTAREFSVLDYLMRHPGEIVSSSELIDHAWDGAYDGWSNVVRSTVRHLRRKLTARGERDPIVTHRGSGYSIGDAA